MTLLYGGRSGSPPQQSTLHPFEGQACSVQLLAVGPSPTEEFDHELRSDSELQSAESMTLIKFKNKFW